MKKKHKVLKAVFITAFLLLLGFGGFVGIRIATMDAEVTTEFTYKTPELPTVEIVSKPNYGQWAVAVNGSVILKSEEKLPQQPTASTAKMILALAIMEQKPFDKDEPGEGFAITQEMYDRYTWYKSHNGSTTTVALGGRISEYDALASTLLASSNNMADSLAIWAFGNLGDYKLYAMEMLKKLGITDTKIGIDASGYDESTVSTAEDLVKIANELLKQPVLAEIVARPEAVVPVEGSIKNTNQLLGVDGIIGVKTGYIGNASGYCLVSGYKEGNENVTVALLGAPTREASFDDSQKIVEDLQNFIKTKKLVEKDEEVGHYATWWAGNIPIKATEELDGILISHVEPELVMAKLNGKLDFKNSEIEYSVPVEVEEFPREPTFWQKFLHVFGWQAN